jgi:hypothetical protein
MRRIIQISVFHRHYHATARITQQPKTHRTSPNSVAHVLYLAIHLACFVAEDAQLQDFGEELVGHCIGIPLLSA